MSRFHPPISKLIFQKIVEIKREVYNSYRSTYFWIFFRTFQGAFIWCFVRQRPAASVLISDLYTVICGDFGLPRWLRKTSLNCNISKAILSFLLFFSDSALHHSDVSIGPNFEFMKVFRFEEDRRMCKKPCMPFHFYDVFYL